MRMAAKVFNITIHKSVTKTKKLHQNIDMLVYVVSLRGFVATDVCNLSL
jgi:hypothetical protein